MKSFIEWLEGDLSRTRKFLAIGTFITWVLSAIASYVSLYFKIDTSVVFSLITAQFAAVIAFYMVTKPKKGQHE